MATVEYDPIPVVDPTTKAPRTDLWGAKLTVVFHDTNIPVPNLLEAGSKAPLPNPFTVSAIGFTPSIAIVDGPVRVDYVSANGEFRTPVTSFSGAQANMDEAAASAAESAALAQAAIDLADVVDFIPGANITFTPTTEGVVIASTATGDSTTGTSNVASWADIKTFPDFPPTFRPTIGSGAQDAVAGNDARLTDQRTPTDGSVTDAKVAAVSPSNSGISLDKTRDSSTRVAMTPAERTKLANLGAGGITTVTVEDLPDRTMLFALKVGGVWEARPSADPNKRVMFIGPSPFPPVVTSGTAGMYEGDLKFTTP